MTNAFITPLTSEVNALTKTVCVVYAFLLTLYKLLSCKLGFTTSPISSGRPNLNGRFYILHKSPQDNRNNSWAL